MDRKERLEFLVRRNEGKRYKDDYLAEMNSLLNIRINETSLISLEETDQIKKILKERSKKTLVSKVFAFDNKEEIRNILNTYSGLFEGGIYILSGYSEYCVALFINNIEYFDFYFSFEAEHSGVVFIVASDLKSVITLDFYEEDEKKNLEVEVSSEL